MVRAFMAATAGVSPNEHRVANMEHGLAPALICTRTTTQKTQSSTAATRANLKQTLPIEAGGRVAGHGNDN
jgi:hypothetical protein